MNWDSITDTAEVWGLLNKSTRNVLHLNYSEENDASLTMAQAVCRQPLTAK